MQKYTVKQTVTYYAVITAPSPEAALEIAELEGRVELDAEEVESEWEVVQQNG